MEEKATKNKNGVQVSLNPDTTPILYTDNISMTADEDGVVMNVTQRVGPTNQGRIVARIGMSRSHAKKFLEKLGELLLRSEGNLFTGSKIKN